jgi:hypothetical protein
MGNKLSISNIFNGKLSKMELIAGLFVPMSQVYFRLIKLNGSLDKPWLLLPFFLMFPLSILPTFMIHFGMLKPGAGGPVYDNYMYIPVIFYVLFNMFLENLESDFDMILRLAGVFAVSIIPYYLREARNCKAMGMNQMANVLSNAALVLGVTQMCFGAMQIASFLPLVGTAFSLLGMLREIPVIGEGLIFALWYLPAYMFINVFNSAGGLGKYCGRQNHWMILIGGLVASVIGYNIDSMLG